MSVKEDSCEDGLCKAAGSSLLVTATATAQGKGQGKATFFISAGDPNTAAAAKWVRTGN